MTYAKVATAKTPALIIYLIDVSGSMATELDGAPKIEHVNQAIEKVLIKMVERSTRGEIISPRYKLAIAAYSTQVSDILGGVQTIDQVAQKGVPVVAPSHTTDTAAAFEWARDLLKQELPKMNGLPAPMICHLTDGKYTGADPQPIAQEIMQMGNDDGNVLIENIYVDSDLTKTAITDPEQWTGIHDVSQLNDPYAQKLFNMSSPLPQRYAEVILEEGYNLRPNVKMLIPATSKELIELAFAMSGATPTVESH
jgi:uncharacterized protein YegL